MRKVALLYNPDSGRKGKGRLQQLEAALKVLRDAKIEAQLVPTESREAAEALARQAIDSGCDTIFACGGDGTIHNVAQVLAHSPAALGILPMGTANALAHDLRLPLSAVGAAKAALTCIQRRVALGQVTCRDFQGVRSSRYFVITAGIGVDAHLFYKLLAGTKQRLGMAAYYAKAWHLWFTYPMTRFTADYRETGAQEIKSAEVTELLSVRIRDFGGVLRELAPGASLARNDMRVILCRTSKRLAYLAYVTRRLLRNSSNVPGIDLLHCSEVACQYRPGPTSPNPEKIYVEADGELIGMLPAQISVVPDALTLLAPPV